MYIEEIKSEILAITKEIEYAVTTVKISSVNSFTLTTKEGAVFNLCLRSFGLEVVSLTQYNSSCEEETVAVGQIFETIYSFLTTVSPSYRQLFANSLAQKLSSIASKHE